MPALSADQILALCDNWYGAATQQNGFAISGATEQFRLLRNGMQFHELDHDALSAAVVGLSKVLLLPGLNTVIDQDHFGLWSWCGELLLGAGSQYFQREQYELKRLFETAIHASLAGCNRPVNNREEWQEQVRISQQQPHHAREYVYSASLALSYLAFPLLEGLLKRRCARYVAFDGQVVARFEIPNGNGRLKVYEPGSKCSSLKHLLMLHHAQVAAPQLVAKLDEFKDLLARFDPAQDGYSLIYGWRNDSLHGSANFQTIGGTMLNLSLLIALFEIQPEFAQRQRDILQRLRWNGQNGVQAPWSYYPPY